MSIVVRRSDAALLAIGVVAVLNGCATGQDSVLFVTKTSLGIDADSKPPAFSVGFDRKEGTLAPVFSDGILPVMAGFNNTGGFFNQAIGQSFATGNAAILMARYLASNAAVGTGSTIPAEEITGKAAVAAGGERKRYFFGTDTSFAFKVTFGLETGGYPDSMSLGYKRKEFAYVPLIEGNGGVSLPSLLATTGFTSASSTPNTTGVIHSQFFATGLAADYLAATPAIREVVAPRMLPEAAAALENIPDAADVFGDADDDTQ